MQEKNAPKLGDNKMRTMPVGRLLFTMALPLAISMLVQAFYNVIDSIYVARISESAVTALSLAFPVQSLIIALGTGTGVGVNAMLSKSLGEKNQENVNKAATHGLFLAGCCSVIFLIFGLFFTRAGKALAKAGAATGRALQKGYAPGDGNCVVLELKDATARFCKFGEDERVVTF